MRAEEPEGYEADEHAIAEAFRQIAADVSPSPDFCARVLNAARQSRSTRLSLAARVRAGMAKWASMVPAQWATASVFGLLLLWLTLSAGFAWWPFTRQVTVAVSYKDEELLGISNVGHEQEDQLGMKITPQYTVLSGMLRHLDDMVASDAMKWDLIIVDNDTLGPLVQKELVEDLSQYRPYEELIPGDLIDPLPRHVAPGDDGRYFFVPFRLNVKLTYYDEEDLRKASPKEPPIPWEDLQSVVEGLKGRVAIQAHPGKAAAVTAFEFVTAMGGDPLTLADEGARRAFTRLWNLAPSLAPASNTIQFDSANDMLINDEASLVSNWTYGIKVVIDNAEKRNIRVSQGWLEGGKQVLGGDMLAIPKGARHPERAIKLIELLVAKPTQHTLADRLFWAPVREDVYNELFAQKGKGHFRVIRETLRTAVMRPTTPEWGLIEEILSDALQDVLRQGRAAGREAYPDDIEALLRPYAARLRKIPREYMPCDVVLKKTAQVGRCEVEVQDEKSFKDLVGDLLKEYGIDTTPAILAKINGRNDRKPVSRKNMKILLVPKPVSGNQSASSLSGGING